MATSRKEKQSHQLNNSRELMNSVNKDFYNLYNFNFITCLVVTQELFHEPVLKFLDTVNIFFNRGLLPPIKKHVLGHFPHFSISVWYH